MKTYEKYLNEKYLTEVDLEEAFEKFDELFNIIESYIKDGVEDKKMLPTIKKQLKKSKQEIDKLFNYFEEDFANI